MSCDKTCLSCNGSNRNECTSCYQGSQLKIIPDEGTYCFSFSERSSDNNYGVGTIENRGETLKEPNGNFSSFIFVFLPGMFIVLSFAILVVYRRFFFGNGSDSFSYTPVAFDNNSKDDEQLLEAEYNDESETEANNNEL